MTSQPDYLPTSERAPETAMKRLEAMLAEAGTAAHGTELGKMRLRGEITVAQFAACDWFAELHAAYLAAIDAKTVRSGSAEPASKSEPPDPFSRKGRARALRDRYSVQTFVSAKLVAMANGADSYRRFCSVVLDGERPFHADREAVRTISSALGIHRAAASRFRRGRR